MTRAVHNTVGEPKEPSKAILAFAAYRELGPNRSLSRLLEQFVKQETAHLDNPETPLPPTTNIDTLKTWSAKFGWQQRIADWTAEQDMARRREFLKQQQKQAADNARLMQSVGEGALGVAAAILASLVDQQTGALTGEVSPRDVPPLMKAGADLLQLATGQPTQIVQAGDATQLEEVLREADEETRNTVLRGMRAALDWRTKQGKG